MDSLRRILAVFLLLLPFLLLRCQAQSVHGFNWGFVSSSTNFQECHNFPLQLKPLNSSTSFVGVPPYYMLALEVQGITSVTPIGSDAGNLAWQNTHRNGAHLLLTVMDSAGNTGGFSTQVFQSIAGDTSCLQPAPTASTLRIVPNVTDSLQTCQPWGLNIIGGTKPYNVTFGQVASGVITNVTMGPEDDVFTFINRAVPGAALMAAVVDANGQWGVSTGTVATMGSSDTDCVGLISTSSTKAQVQAQLQASNAAASAAAKAHTRTVALGVVFGLIVPLLIGGAVGWWWWRRRKRRAASRSLARPLPYDPERQMQQRSQQQTQQPQDAGRPSLNLDMSQVSRARRVDSQPYRTPSWAVDSADSPVVVFRQTDSPTSIDMTSTELHQATPTPYLTPTTLLPRSAIPRSATAIRSATIARSPLTPPEPIAMTPNSTSPAATLSPQARYRKALEAHAEAQAQRGRLVATNARQSPVAGPSGLGLAGAGAGTGARRPPVQRTQSAGVMRTFPAQPLPKRVGSSLRLPPVAAIPGASGPDIIIQHRDGGIVEELPPPYMDRDGRGRDRDGAGPSTPRARARGSS
ncbi:hypothetical protein C8Q78DRAFT_374571 [Trametes maxima]|nr:hypothetical protein C8Q78DRAFT_374571 [Trametes maxima]